MMSDRAVPHRLYIIDCAAARLANYRRTGRDQSKAAGRYITMRSCFLAFEYWHFRTVTGVLL